ncbi:MAG: R3H domain-containing nucleic acid-binding protein [Patescibacteria group bacterium]
MDTEAIKSEVRAILEQLGYGSLVSSIEAHQGLTSRFNIELLGEANMLIGERGANLAALEHVVKKILRHRNGPELTFTLDINNYRRERLEDLKQDVKTAAKEVRLYNKRVPLRSMSAFERRVVHLLLAEYPDIATESTGEEPNRRVVIKPYP